MRNKQYLFYKIIFLSNIFFSYNIFAQSIVYFSPKDDVSNKLISLIDESKNKIYAAVYVITDKSVVNALIRAKNDRDVDVQIITDKDSVKNKFGKVNLLKENGIDVFVYKPKNQEKQSFLNDIMHNKFAVFDDKRVVTGSFNWTVSATKTNRENLICMDDLDVCNRYKQEFEKLKHKCIRRNGGKTKVNNKASNNKKENKNKNVKITDINKEKNNKQTAVEKGLKVKLYDLLKSVRDHVLDY